MKAYLKNYRQSPRKVRLVATAIKGKSVAVAEAELQYLVKRAALPFLKLLQSAVANAKQNFNIEKDNLYVQDVRVDKGIVLKRMMPRARGSAFPIKKRSSHIVMVLAEKGVIISKDKKVKTKKDTKDEKISKPKISKKKVTKKETK
jgi:large subunit ribosomal protein L22